MNDAVSGSGLLGGVSLPVNVSQTPGAMLRAAREASGLHVAALAVAMKVPVKKLEALEADRFDLLVDAVFVRALAASVCRSLKIDPAPILEKLPQNTMPQLVAGLRSINAPFRSPERSGSLHLLNWVKKPAVSLVGIILAGVLVLLLLPEWNFSEFGWSGDATKVGPSRVTAATGSVAGAHVKVTEMPATGALTDASPPEAKADKDVEVSGSAVPSEMSSNVKTLNPATKTEQQIGSSAGNVSAAQLDRVGSEKILAFKARSESWIEVVDSQGVAQIRRLLAAGESASVSGSPPLAVVVGRMDAVDVELRGQPFSMAGIGKDNVARFEVR